MARYNDEADDLTTPAEAKAEMSSMRHHKGRNMEFVGKGKRSSHSRRGMAASRHKTRKGTAR